MEQKTDITRADTFEGASADEAVCTKQNAISFLCVAAGLLLGVGAQWVNLDSIASPLLAFGAALRALAISRMWGNLLLWALVLCTSLLPVLYAIYRQSKVQGGGCATDWLLVLLSMQLFAGWFYIVNPSYIPTPQGLEMQGAYLSISLWAMVATLGSYALLRFAGAMQGIPHAQAAQLLPRLLRMSGYFIYFLAAASASQGFLTALSTAKVNNGAVAGASTMASFLLALLGLGLSMLGGVMLLWGAQVATALLQDPYAEDTLVLCQWRAKGCLAVFAAALCCGIACNLVQLIFFAHLQDVNIQWSIPLLPLLLAGTLFLLCHYVGGARALAEDNESII